MRVYNTFRNAIVSTIMQVLLMFASLAVRYVFGRVLTAEYLGIDSIFVDVINLLSVAELGFATAMTFALYEPIAKKEYAKINSILALYKKVYRNIGIIILVVGLVLTPFIGNYFDDIPSINESIYLIFILYLGNSVISYFYSYKQALITAYQEDFIVQQITKGFTIIAHIIEIIILLVTHNFLLYLLIRISNTLIVNIVLSRTADRKYTFLDINNAEKLSSEDTNEINKNVKSMFFHKFGNRIVFSTDNLFISIFSTLKNAGYYSNYHLITNNVALLVDMLLNASIASVGDLKNDNDLDKSEDIFEIIFFLNFLLYSVTAAILFVLLSDFINVWFNETYVLSEVSLFLIILNYYIHGMRRTAIIFRDAWGLFYYDRFKPVLEIIVNIVLQIILGRFFGLNGILLGTSLTIVLTSTWIEPIVLYKYGFSRGVGKYFAIYLKYFLKFLLLIGISYFIFSNINTEGLIQFIIKAAISSILIVIIFIILNFYEKRFKQLLQILYDVVMKLIRREK